MSANRTVETRSPNDIGYVSWVIHRISALTLVALLALHVGVQVFPQYGFTAVYEYGVYQQLLDVTLTMVLLHGFLGVRATVLETSMSAQLKRVFIWFVGLVLLALLVYRLLG